MELFQYSWNRTTAPRQTAPKIVFLHGMGGTGALWRPVAAALEEKLNIMAVDQRGHGQSRNPHLPGSRGESGYTPLHYGQDVIDTLQILEFFPTWIVGHSMGVRTALAAAHLKPNWVRGLILVDLGFSGIAGGGLGEGLAQFLERLPTTFSSRAEARAFMDQHCPDPSIAQYLLAVSTQASDGRITFPFDHSALIQTIHAARDVSVKKWVRELGIRKMPILILRGQNSLVWSHEDFEKERADFSDLPSVTFQEVPGAGHGLPFEQRAKFVEIVLKFTGSPT